MTSDEFDRYARLQPVPRFSIEAMLNVSGGRMTSALSSQFDKEREIYKNPLKELNFSQVDVKPRSRKMKQRSHTWTRTLRWTIYPPLPRVTSVTYKRTTL